MQIAKHNFRHSLGIYKDQLEFKKGDPIPEEYADHWWIKENSIPEELLKDGIISTLVVAHDVAEGITSLKSILTPDLNLNETETEVQLDADEHTSESETVAFETIKLRPNPRKG